MIDDTDKSPAALEERLRRLPREIPPAEGTWRSIERAILDEPLDTRLRSFAKSVAPQPDLWPSIAQRIRDDERRIDRRLFRPSTLGLLAASVALFVIGGVLLRGAFGPPDGATLVPEPDLAADRSIESAAGDDGSFSSRLLFPGGADPAASETQAIYQEHIALVRQQREAIEASLEEYPNDLSLRALWRHAYETELSLIDAAGRSLSTI